MHKVIVVLVLLTIFPLISYLIIDCLGSYNMLIVQYTKLLL